MGNTPKHREIPMKSFFIVFAATAMLAFTPTAFAQNQSKPGIKVAAACVPCTTRCAQCGRQPGSYCYTSCQANGNVMVRAGSPCGARFAGCR
jgi:hypothetical protein